MALVACPECNAQISDQAAACPKCGLPVKLVVRSATAPEVTPVKQNMGVKTSVGTKIVYSVLGFLLFLFVAGQIGETLKGLKRTTMTPEETRLADAAEVAKTGPRTLRDSAPVTRTNFKSMVKDGFFNNGSPMFADSLEHVMEVLGPPDSTQDSGNTKYVYYKGLTKDDLTGKTDNNVQLIFEIHYEGPKQAKYQYHLVGINFS